MAVTTFADLDDHARTRFLAHQVKVTGLPLDELTEGYQTCDDADFLEDFKAFMTSGAPAEQEAPAEPETPDTFTKDLVAESAREERKAARGTTTVNLGHAGRLVQSIAHEIVKCATTTDDIKLYRKQTIGLFAGPMSRSRGKTVTTDELNEYVKVHYLRTLTPPASHGAFDRVAWEHLRTLAKLAEPLPGITDLTIGVSYLETWQLRKGWLEKLVEVIATLAKHPMSPGGLKDIMDAHEKTLSGVVGVVPPSRSALKTAFMKSVRAGMKKLKMDAAALVTCMLEDELLTFADIVAAGEKLAAAEVTVDATTVDEPATAVTLTLNATTTPNHNPIPQTRTVHKAG